MEQQSADALELTLATTVEEIDAWVARHNSGGPFGVAVRGRWSAGTGIVDEIAAACDDGDVAVADMRAIPRACADGWRIPGREGAARRQGAALALRASDIDLAGLVGDTALAAYLLLPGQRSFPLADLTARFLHRDLSPTAVSDQMTIDGLDDVDHEELARHAVSIAELNAVLMEQLGPGGRALLEEMELPLQSVLADMEAVGIAVDLAAAAALGG